MDEQTPSENWLEADSNAADSAELMQTIQARIQARRQALGYDATQFPSFGKVSYPRKPDDIPYDPDLYHHLHLVNKLYYDVPNDPVLVASPAVRVPVLGKLWSMIRGSAHNLVLFYVSRAQEHEVEMNRHLVGALNLLTAENQRQQREIAQLQAQLDQLQQPD